MKTKGTEALLPLAGNKKVASRLLGYARNKKNLL